MRQWSWWLGAVWCFVSWVLPSCGEVGAGTARGFGSRQLVAIRDPTIQLIGLPAEKQFVYATVRDPASGGGAAVYWSVNLDDGRVENLGNEHPDFASGLPGNGFSCGAAGVGSEVNTLSITDRQSDVTTIIEGYVSGQGCPTGNEPEIVILRADDAGVKALWTGPYDRLQPAPVDLLIQSIVIFHGIAGVTRPQTVTVVAALPAESDRLGLFDVDLTTFAHAQVVPPVLANAAWAEGAMIEGTLASTSLVRRWLTALDVDWLGSHYVYPRLMSDGGTTMFVGPLSTGLARELALFRRWGASLFELDILPPASTNVFPYRHPTLQAWYETNPGSTDGLLRLWDDTGQKMVTCSLATIGLPTGHAAPDARRVLFLPSQNGGTAGDAQNNAGPLLLVSPDVPDACTVLAERVTHAAFSPDGASLCWLAAPPTGDHELWTAAGDGSGPRRLGAGAMDEPRFIDETRIRLTLGEDLVWLDLREDPVQLHYVAEKVFGNGQVDLAWPWLVIAYQRSATDGTGTLGIVNWETGAKRPISSWVSQYLTFWSPPYPTLPLRVIYLVRGRNPSSEDGLWLAEIAGEDLPP